MSVFAWRRRATRHFGEQWVPFAELHLRSISGRWRTFSVQVDSGAVVSVLSCSAAELLGIELEKGDSIDLAGVSAPPRRYLVHELSARIGEMPEFTMRLAIADQEHVPNLLGRLDVLDRFQIDLDPSLEETRLSLPWLDPDDRRIWRACLDAEDRILKSWSNYPLPGRVDEAAKRFVNRADQLVTAAAGLLKLHRGYELPLIIRSLFDLSVQFEFLMLDPEARSSLYLEYEHVTRHRTTEAWLKLPGMGAMLQASPLREEGDERNRREVARIESQYRIKQDQTRLRMHWYPGTLRQLANEVGRTVEYDAFYSLYSAWAHGDPWTAGLLDLGHSAIWHPLVYWARMLTRIADAKQIVLAGEHYQLLVELSKGMTA